MSEKQLLKLAESGEWKDRAIRLLKKKTDAALTLIHEFVDVYWEKLFSDEENLYNFNVYESEYCDVYAY